MLEKDQAVKARNDSYQKDKVDKIKKLVQATLERIELYRNEKRDIDEILRILNQDLKDLKEGRLDRIEERQKLHPKAKDISVIQVERAPVTKVDPTKENDPYQARWYTPYKVWANAQEGTSELMQDTSLIVNNSFIKDNVGGTYKLMNGSVISL
jgi:hypothetical protein